MMQRPNVRGRFVLAGMLFDGRGPFDSFSHICPPDMPDYDLFQMFLQDLLSRFSPKLSAVPCHEWRIERAFSEYCFATGDCELDVSQLSEVTCFVRAQYINLEEFLL